MKQYIVKTNLYDIRRTDDSEPSREMIKETNAAAAMKEYINRRTDEILKENQARLEKKNDAEKRQAALENGESLEPLPIKTTIEYEQEMTKGTLTVRVLKDGSKKFESVAKDLVFVKEDTVPSTTATATAPTVSVAAITETEKTDEQAKADKAGKSNK